MSSQAPAGKKKTSMSSLELSELRPPSHWTAIPHQGPYRTMKSSSNEIQTKTCSIKGKRWKNCEPTPLKNMFVKLDDFLQGSGVKIKNI